MRMTLSFNPFSDLRVDCLVFESLAISWGKRNTSANKPGDLYAIGGLANHLTPYPPRAAS